MLFTLRPTAIWNWHYKCGSGHIWYKQGVLPLKKVWILAAPLIIAGIGFILEALIPWPFNGFSSGFESFGWIIMFLGGVRCVKQSEEMDR